VDGVPNNRFGVILADPPWRFDNWSKAGEWKNAARHYPCLTLEELKALRVSLNMDFICAPDSALIMWATFPMLPQAIELMAAWGFAYKSGGAWAKMSRNGNPAFGAGYLYRSAAELWLLGTRGSPKVRSRSVRNLIVAERREHSRKPDQMHDDIERLFDGPYLEMFARAPRDGWTVWGNQTDKFSPRPESPVSIEEENVP
jgi:N6-adenosine-specific RNA methylase IME4